MVRCIVWILCYEEMRKYTLIIPVIGKASANNCNQKSENSLHSANSGWRGNQAAHLPLVQRKGRRRNLAVEGVGEWKQLPLIADEVVRFCFVFLFFSFRQLRWQNNYAGGFVKRNSNYFGVNIANEPSDTATVRGGGERLAKHTLISHFLLTRSGKEGERETEKKRHRGIREQPQ